MKIFVLVSFVLSIVSCEKGNPVYEKIILNAYDIELIDKGQIPYSFDFHSLSESSEIENCQVRTINIKKNDNIKYIEAYTYGKVLNINIVSYPYDFDCNDINCFTVHDVKFKLLGLRRDDYTVKICINGGCEKSFNHTITGIKNKELRKK